MTDWQPEPKPVLPELEPKFEHAVYPPERVHFVPLQEKLTGNEWAALKAYAQHASIGEPDGRPQRSTPHTDERAQRD